MYNKTTYKMISSEICIENTKYITYGIAGDTVAFADVSTDKSLVENMTNTANSVRLEECHLMDFIEDCLI